MRNLQGSIGWALLLAGVVGAAQAAPKMLPTPDCKTGSKRCHVLVTVVASGGTCSAEVSLDPDKVQVLATERNKRYRIVWVLPDGYVFRPAMGDGVVIEKDMLDMPDDHDEFGSGQVSDKDDGEASGKAKGTRWRLNYFNKVGDRFKYKIQFREAATGKVYSCDPTISNLEAH